MIRPLRRCLVLALLAASSALPQAALPPVAPAAAPRIDTIRFELVHKHIYLPVRVNGSRPLSFVFDTGAKVAMIDIERAKELGLNLSGEVGIGGAGKERRKGAWVKEASWTLPGLDAFSQPVVIAAPLAHLAPRFGRDFDGILGSDFIARFVVEIDYEARVLRLHDRDSFVYRGAGRAVPITLRHGHPILEAEVTPVAGKPIRGKFVVDVGAGTPLTLHSPFVAKHRLPGPGVATIRAIGAGGAGGSVRGRTGRVDALTIGPFTLKSPLAFFAQDEEGAFASSAIQGNLGQPLLSRFRLFLDYGRERIIFEPTARLSDPFDRAFSGVSLEALGEDYTTFRVREVLEGSPATDAGIRVGDVLTAIDGQAASEVRLDAILDLLERPLARTLTIRRGGETLTIVLTPRRMV